MSAVNFSDRKGGVSLDDNCSSSTHNLYSQRERVDIKQVHVLQRRMLNPHQKSGLDGGPAATASSGLMLVL